MATITIELEPGEVLELTAASFFVGEAGEEDPDPGEEEEEDEEACPVYLLDARSAA